jgi:hypothetical protein
MRKILDRTIEAQYHSQMKRPTFRPDLTDYLPYIEALTDKLNEESILKMSRTDAVKIAIELACKNVLPDVRVEKKRKLYQTLKM